MAAVPGMVPKKSILNPEKPGMDTGGYGGGSRGNPYVPPKIPTPKKSSPGPGPSGTGGGRDTPAAGKTRSEFEKQRQKDRGTGVDRPPIYKPPTDYRGGYGNRATSDGGTQKIPPLSPASRPIPGSSAVHGMIPQY